MAIKFQTDDIMFENCPSLLYKKITHLCADPKRAAERRRMIVKAVWEQRELNLCYRGLLDAHPVCW